MFRSSLCWLALVAVPPALAAGPGPGDDKLKGETPAEKVRKALDQVIDVDIENQSLQLAIAQLREQTKVNFVLDRLTAAGMGVNPDEGSVNLKLQKVRLRTALRTLLNQYSLSFAIVGETVLITSEEMAVYRQLKQRVNVDVDRVQFGVALKQLARETGANLLVDSKAGKEAQTPVTLQLDDVPLETAVRLLAELTGLKPVRMGNVLFVTSRAAAVELRAEPELAPHPQPRVAMDQDVINMIGPGGVMLRGGAAVPAPAVAPPPPPGKDDEKPPEKPADKPPEKDKP